MTDLVSALFRIDPTEGLVEYAQAVKPYHSKVLDIFVEYVYTETLASKVTDKMIVTIGLYGPGDILGAIGPDGFPISITEPPVIYTCGYGLVWDAYGGALPADLPHTTVISGAGVLKINAQATTASPTLILAANPTGYVFTVGHQVVFSTDGTTPPDIFVGVPYYVVAASPTSLQVSDTLGGSPIVMTTIGTGQLYAMPQDLPYNTFLVAPPTPNPKTVVVSSLITNQFTLATPFNVTDVQPLNGTWSVATDLVSAGPNQLVVGDAFYIASNTDANANGQYVVASIAFAAGATTITTVRPISLVATVSGTLNVVVKPDDIAYLPVGASVKIASPGTVPAPLIAGSTYYFEPTAQIGVFNLAHVRYPTQPAEYVDLTTLGSGQLTIDRVEPFVPGEAVIVTGSTGNDGIYYVGTIVPEGGNYRISVPQAVPITTPIAQPTDGVMTYGGNFGDPFCAVAHSPALHAETFIAETLHFEFGDDPTTPADDPIGYDVHPLI